MEILSRKPQIDFIGIRFPAFVFSGVLAFASLAVLLTRGINYSIDFVGGNVVHLTYEQPLALGDLRAALSKSAFPDALPQQFSGTNSFAVRLKAREDADSGTVERFLASLRAADPARPFRVDSQEFVGPTVGQHLFKQAVLALAFALTGIVVYVGFRFANPLWGVAGVVALAHDVLAAAGLISLLGLEFDLTLVAALLTIAGWSINDTVVVFDRMRERLAFARREPLAVMINTSINDMISRTLVTSGLVFATVLTLLVFGGPVLRDFALCMTFGIIVGTYSSIAVAAPLVYEWEARFGASAGKPGDPALSTGSHENVRKQKRHS